MTALHVACASDSRYLPHCAAMMRSLAAQHPGEDLRLHLLHDADVKARDIEQLSAMLDGSSGALIPHPVSPDALAGLPSWGRIPATMWSRILLPELLPDVARILYLDVDVLAVNPLDELWGIDLSNRYLAAVTNVPERHRLGHAAELGLPGPRSYFNSGVLLMNLELMRSHGITAALRECVRTRSADLLWPDQDALNIVLGRKRESLHPRFNLMNSIRTFPWAAELLDADDVAEAIAQPAIVHFEGPRENKPWHLLSNHPYRDVYLEHRRHTPWPRPRRDGISATNLTRLAARRIRQRLRFAPITP